MLSLIAAAFYGVVVASCLLALTVAITRRQPRWHVLGWSALALLFVVLAAMRVFVVEELLREVLRLLLRAEGTYDDRGTLQAPVFAVLFISAAAIGGFLTFHIARTIRGRRNIATMAAITSGGLLVFLLMLRIVSLHSADQLLYGPMKLNWFTDLGSSTVVLATAVYYWRVVTGRPR